MSIPNSFEWDENKRQANIEKHGIDFARIARIFTHPIVEWADNRRDYGETRMILLGVVDNRVLCMVYTMRGSICRIISARKANQNERRAYYQSFPRRMDEDDR
ncbi:MAG: BrnT family toxin [Microcystaceae cyanobacterium]